MPELQKFKGHRQRQIAAGGIPHKRSGLRLQSGGQQCLPNGDAVVERGGVAMLGAQAIVDKYRTSLRGKGERLHQCAMRGQRAADKTAAVKIHDGATRSAGLVEDVARHAAKIYGR